MSRSVVAGCLGLLAALLAPAVARAQYELHGPIDLTAATPLTAAALRTDEQPAVAPEGPAVLVGWLAERPGMNARSLVRRLACDGAVADPGVDYTSPNPLADYREQGFGTALGAPAWAVDAYSATGSYWQLDIRFAPAPGSVYTPAYPLPGPMVTSVELPSTIAGDPSGNATLWLAASGGDGTTTGSVVYLYGVALSTTGVRMLLPGSPLQLTGYARARAAALPDGSSPAFGLIGTTGYVSLLIPPLNAATEIATSLGLDPIGPGIAALGTTAPQYLLVTGASHTGLAGTTHCLAYNAMPAASPTIDGAACPQPGFTVADVAAAGRGPLGDAWVGAVEHGGTHVFLGAYGSAWNQTVSAGGAGSCVHPHIASSSACTVIVASCGLDGARRTLAWIASPSVTVTPDAGVVDAGRNVDAAGPGTDGSQNAPDGRARDDAANDAPSTATDATVDVPGAIDDASRGPRFRGGACQCAVGRSGGRARPAWCATLGGLLALGVRRRGRRARRSACR